MFIDGNGIYLSREKAATGFMLGSITGAISGGVSTGLEIAGFATESYFTRAIMAGKSW